MAASLLTLPGEILNPILLKGDFTSQDLSALSRVCKPLRQLTLPRLYEAIVFNWSTASSGTPKIHFFLRSLLETPCLSALVKHFRCIGGKNKGVRYAKQSPGTLWEEGATKTLEDGELVKMAKDVVHTADLPEPLLWIDALETGNIDAFVALILSQLPQLQTFHLDVDFITNNRFIGFLFKHALSSNNQSSARRCLSTFAHLRHVGFISALSEQSLPSRASLDTDQVMSLFYFPAIEILDLYILNHRALFSWPKDNLPCASNLRTLNLTDCEVDEEGLKMVLSVTPKLERLNYHRQCDIDPPGGFPAPYLDLTILGKALVQVRTTLRHLSLSILFYANTALEVDDDRYHGISNLPFLFESFDKLEYLEVPFVILFGPHQARFPGLENLMPQFLRHLCLRDDMGTSTYYEWTASTCLVKIRDMLARRDQLAPHLESITLRLRESEESEWDEGEQDELRRLCSVAGLDCTVSKVLPD